MKKTNGKFYLGRTFDAQRDETTSTPLIYDPADLTTHAFVVGMTGSGKTGLCLDLLEEAALAGIPALMLDPKGDITNSLLHFPELAPQDFAPWVDPNQARREGKSIDQAATETAARWKKGLAEWDIGPERMHALQNAAEFTVFTPGSDAGVPVSILATLKAPGIPWEQNKEIIREKIAATATALLGLVGLDDIDPVRSREHILLANIFERSWRAGKDLDLSELIMQVQAPPFEKLGVFDVNMFFPQKDRFELAMALNNILAAPGFQSWREGVPLDIPNLLRTPDGRPRHSVFYIAHLNDEERMFFTTLLFGAVETWMRTQSGSATLRALIYFDEIFGYLPAGPKNPPSKEPMLRMLKQARAFGVGLVLATQNPVDVDYKALSNAGTWFIGKLQTDRDKERLLDGLTGSGALDRRAYDALISSLGKRVFLLHNVHAKGPQIFRTRWAMNYLAGPMTRAQIPALNALARERRVRAAVAPTPGLAPGAQAAQTPLGAGGQAAAPVSGLRAHPQPDAAPTASPAQAARVSQPPPAPDLPGSVTAPAIPPRVDEFFIPHTLTLSQAAQAVGRTLPQDAQQMGVLYRPALLAQAEVRFLQRKYNLDYETMQTALVPEPDRRGRVRWEDFEVRAFSSRKMDRGPVPGARFAALEAPLTEGKVLTAMKADFADWVYRSLEVTVRANETLKIYAGPNVSKGAFREASVDAAREKLEAEVDKATAQFDRKSDTLKNRLSREARELEQDKTDLQQRKLEEMGTHAENILSLFSKRRRRVTTSLSKRRMTERAKADVEESEDAIAEFEQQLAALKQEKKDKIEDILSKWRNVVEDVTEIQVHPFKKDIMLDMFGVAWAPYLLVAADGRMLELPGFGE